MGAPKLGQEKLWPRDPIARAARAEELRRLYEVERLGVVEIGARFGVSYRSVGRVLAKAGIQTRKPGIERRSTCSEDDCNLPVHHVLHRTNGYHYGHRCRLHWILYRLHVNQKYRDKRLGKDETWLRTTRQLLARVARLNREVSRSLNPASPPATTSPAV